MIFPDNNKKNTKTNYQPKCCLQKLQKKLRGNDKPNNKPVQKCYKLTSYKHDI